jgi:iron-sulfur cluster insertion protein
MNIVSDAIVRIEELLSEENNPDLKLRVFVQGGGCSGLQYGFTFVDTKEDDDYDYQFGKVTVLVDAISMDYLRNSTLRYEDGIMGAGFSIDNPQARTTCGCGSSFSPY